MSLSWNGAKEAFVSDLTGSRMEDVVYITTLPSVLVVIYMCVASLCMRSRRGRGTKGSHGVRVVLGAVEFLVLVVPEVIQLTMSDDDHVVMRVAVWGALASVAVAMAWRHDDGKSVASASSIESRELHETWRSESIKMIQDAISMHRANVMLMTCLAILAVDFPVFPRKYGKTEVYGTSLMDAGVGSIILCSSYVEGVKQMQSARYRQGTGRQRLLKESSFSSLLRIVMLLVLGIGRPVVVSLIGYHVHVGEYGMHWNFFLTLAVLRACISNVPRSTSPLALGVLLLAAHQYGLSRFGLAALANTRPSSDERRTMNLFYQNKEGIISLPGYLALHFLGVWCAKVHIWLVSKPKARVMRGWNLFHVLVVGVLWSMYWYATTHIEDTSRRSCNVAFVMWMLAINLQAVVVNTVCLNIISLIRGGPGTPTPQEQRRVESRCIPPLLNSLNKGMLYIFLLSNILTGAINSAIDTLAMDDATARYILVAYMALVYASSRALFVYT